MLGWTVGKFLEPGRLWWLLLVAALLIMYGILWYAKSGWSKKAPEPSRLDLVLPRERVWKRHVAVLLAVLSLVALICAYARPKGTERVPRERATVVLVIDVSRSMAATDVKPSRLAAAQETAIDFVGELPKGFNVAVVSFYANADLLVQPTTDRALVIDAIKNLKLGPSTAMGEGIYTGLDALDLAPRDPNKPNDPPPAAMVLLSDGARNVGRYSDAAAREAKKRHCPIHAIAYGRQDGYIEEGGRRQPVPPDERELRIVANLSGGQFYTAPSKEDLKKVYEKLAQQIGYEDKEKEVTGRFIWLGLLSAAFAALAVISIAARWP